MRNIKAEQTEQFSWCINFSQFAQAMIIITVNSIISSNLLLLQFHQPFHTSFFSVGDSKKQHTRWPSGGAMRARTWAEGHRAPTLPSCHGSVPTESAGSCDGSAQRDR